MTKGQTADEADPAGIIATFREQLVPGSYLILSHGSAAARPAADRDPAPIWDRTRSPVTGRTRREIEDLFSGFDLVPPGLVATGEWGTTEAATPDPASPGLVLAGVGRAKGARRRLD